ncbi:MAG: glutathione S-transferase family protein [Alphaproteobacteria bacterium]|nr:glutathione S-transferase family protein [Alphaproteobacteria bacterium]HRI77107.1 glutathione S-transferase family protein [Alphaproteobacteria bacterium]
MRTLYHLWLHPSSRKVRIALAEKKLDFDLKIEKVWERRTEFLAINPAGDVPVLIEPDGTILTDSQVICEYLNEVYNTIDLMGGAPLQRAETRRLVAWFDHKFNAEVTENLVGEKMMKRFLKMGEPHGPSIRAGHANIHYHLDYIGFLTERRRWLAGDELSLADVTAAAHLSAIDYIGDVPWDEHKAAKDWYARIKSRPAFKPLLDDVIPGFAPPSHYQDLDF